MDSGFVDLTGLAAADHRRELVAVGAVDFGACAVEVALHRAHRHRQSVGDVAIGQACGDKIGDLAFAYGQRQRTAREVQRGGAKPSAGGGKTVRGATCFAGVSAVTGGLIGDGGLRGGVRGQQQRTDLFELLCRGIYCVGIAVGHRGGVRGQRRREPSAGRVGDLNRA